MSREDKGRSGLLRTQVVRGAPYELGGRTLTPEARIVSVGRARATVGARQHGGWGFAFTRVIPTAIVEETEEGERRFLIPDMTGSALRRMLAAAVALVVFFTTIRWLAGRLKKSYSHSENDFDTSACQPPGNPRRQPGERSQLAYRSLGKQ